MKRPLNNVSWIFLLATLASGLGWAFVHYEKVAYALIVGTFGFLGFYLSETAKQAIRARHLANQGWAYLQNTDHTFKVEGNWEWATPLISEWHQARNKHHDTLTHDANSKNDYSEIDKAFRQRVFELLSNTEYAAKLSTHFQHLKETPGKLDVAVFIAENGLEQTQKLSETLRDEDVALLGPEILFHYVNYRTARHLFWVREFAINTYLKNTEAIEAAGFLEDVKNLTFHLLKSQLELKMLRPLIENARNRSLIELSFSLWAKAR